MKNAEQSLLEAEILAADAVGDVIEFWGFRKALGRIWTSLFLAADAVAADTLAERLQMSSGAVSMALSELQEWAVVRRVWRPGQRKEFFEAETDFWKMISKVVRERERFLTESVKDRLTQASAILRQAPQTAEVRASHARVKQLLLFVSAVQTVLDVFIASRRADFSLLGNLLHLGTRPLRSRAGGEA